MQLFQTLQNVVLPATFWGSSYCTWKF